MIDQEVLAKLTKTKNLLAFSAGVDSTALFFLLLDQEIDFDIAIVNYNTRSESDQEIEYAQELADQYSKKVFVKSVALGASNFEKTARDVRYRFFEEIVADQGYEMLITAHQLDDWVEWYFMQFTKGAGFFELDGMSFFDSRKNFTIARPLLDVYKFELENYLIKHDKKYFVDSSNSDEKFTRNRFRKAITTPLISEYHKGIRETFYALKRDRKNLQNSEARQFDDLFVIEDDKPDSHHQADQAIKKLGVVISRHERELLRIKQDFVAGRKIAVGFANSKIYIAPYIKTTIPKKKREEMRIAKIPPLIRGYLSTITYSYQ